MAGSFGESVSPYGVAEALIRGRSRKKALGRVSYFRTTLPGTSGAFLAESVGGPGGEERDAGVAEGAVGVAQPWSSNFKVVFDHSGVIPALEIERVQRA